MAEYDAFGRKKGEDSLRDVGWRVAPPSQPAATATAPAPAEPTGPAVPRARRRRPRPPRRPRVLPRLLFIALVIGALGFFAANAGREVHDRLRTLPELFPTVEPPTDPDGAATAGRPPRGLERASLIRRANLAPAIRRLRTAGLGRLNSIRLAADRIDARLLTRDGRFRSVQITPDGAMDAATSGPPGFGFAGTVPFSSVDSAAPARLVRDAARRLGRSPRRVNYLVFLDFAGEPGWSVFFTDGAHYQADRRGRIVRRVS